MVDNTIYRSMTSNGKTDWHEFFIWIHGWEMTFSEAGRTKAEARAWLCSRLKKWRAANRIIHQ